MGKIRIKYDNELSVKEAIASNKFYVYLHKTYDNDTIYVGSGKRYRCTSTKANKSWLALYNKNNIFVEIYKSNLSEKQARLIETELIKKIGINNLTNVIECCIENLPINCKGINNGNYGNRGSKNPMAVKIVCLYKNGTFIKQYDSIVDVRLDGFNTSNVTNCCKGNRLSHMGRLFMYLSEYNEDMVYEGKVGITHKRKVNQITWDNKLIHTFDSIADTAKLGFNPKNVQQVCKGYKKSHKGFIFKYVSI